MNGMSPPVPAMTAPGAGLPQPNLAPQPAPPASPAGGLQQQGLRAMAVHQVEMARRSLEQALQVLGSESEEGSSVVKALGALSKVSVEAPEGSPGGELSPGPAVEPTGGEGVSMGAPAPGFVGGPAGY